MIQTVNKPIFIQAFRDMGRFEQFGYEALEMLFDYLEELDDSMELDVVSICCDYAHSSVLEVASDYQIDLSECEDDDAKREEVREWLLDASVYIGETGEGFVYCTSF